MSKTTNKNSRKMKLKGNFPTTAAEVERFLWHALEHVKEVPPGDTAAEIIIRKAMEGIV